MVYRQNIHSNPKLILLFIIPVLLIGIAVLTAFLAGILLALIAFAIVAYLDYHIIKFIIINMKSFLKTDENGVFCRTTASEDVRLSWDSISHAGIAKVKGKSERAVFIYSDEEDQLVTIPDQYSGIEEFIKEVSEHAELQTIELEARESLQEKLKEIIA